MCNIVEIRPCDICQRMERKRRLRTFCDMWLCRTCFRRYAAHP